MFSLQNYLSARLRLCRMRKEAGTEIDPNDLIPWSLGSVEAISEHMWLNKFTNTSYDIYSQINATEHIW